MSFAAYDQCTVITVPNPAGVYVVVKKQYASMAEWYELSRGFMSSNTDLRDRNTKMLQRHAAFILNCLHDIRATPCQVIAHGLKTEWPWLPRGSTLNVVKSIGVPPAGWN